MVPTLTFLSVICIRATTTTPQASQENENTTKDVNRCKRYANLIHWARMAHVLEGGIEAPLQFLLQVGAICKVITNYHNVQKRKKC